jgi:DNA-binding NarL/FixJ family response regulator
MSTNRRSRRAWLSVASTENTGAAVTFDGNGANGAAVIAHPRANGHDQRRPGPTRRTTVVIAEDQPFYREGLGRLLGESGIDVVSTVPNGEEALRAVEELAPDVVLMDLNMPGVSGLEATRRLTAEASASRVLILSVSAQEADVKEALIAGASGYVLKDSPVEEVVTAIQAAAAGQLVVAPGIATYLLQGVRDEADGAAHLAGRQLSARELEVLRLMADGKSNQQIAVALVISFSTVRYHISNILMKLQVDNRVQAVVRAVRERLV